MHTVNNTARTNKPICVYDSTPAPMNKANPWFQAGASLFFDRFKAVYAVDDAQEFFEAVSKHPGCDVRAWGHGASGAPYMGRQRLTADHAGWGFVKRVHFRMCAVASGVEGIAFMNALAARGIEVIAHLSNIGFMGCHSHTYGVRARKKATWPAMLLPQHSYPFAPRTILATDTEIPDWVFNPHKK